MGRIKDYAIDPVIEDTDLVIGTDGGVGQNYVTKNYTVGALKEHIQAGSSLTGWARYDDTVYNASNKLALVDGVAVTIPNNAGNVVLSPGAPVFYDSVLGKICASGVNNVYVLTVVFKASASNTQSTHLDFSIYSPVGDFERVSKVLTFAKGNNIEQNFHEVYQYYSDADFAANGAELKINSDGGSAELWDVIYFIQKTQSA